MTISLFLETGYMLKPVVRFQGFTGSPTTFAGLVSMLFIFIYYNTKRNVHKFLLFLAYFLIIYYTKTRLLLLFAAFFPILAYLINKKKNLKGLFFKCILVLVFIYPLYSLLTSYFPDIGSIRNNSGKDTSFGFRYWLYNNLKLDFFSGSLTDMLFGKGMEYSRIFIVDNHGGDYMPHNDFLRLISDWGILGTLFYIFTIYNYAQKNKYSFFIAIIYFTLFYSNMVFNLFFVSVLILSTYIKNNEVR